TTGTKAKRGDDTVDDSVKGGSSSPADVRVGDIVVKLGARQEPVARSKVQEQEVEPTPRRLSVRDDVVKEKDCRVFLRNFRTKTDDVKWAQNGIVATIINGEAVPVVQNRITDA
ncbi:hypothetical protein A2U01_0064325, partial [Trifolium medium]|nr:hypothetical protein [Trifolium medium]